MTIWPELLALLIIVLFAALLYIAIRSNRARNALKTSQVESLGFEAVTSEPGELIRRVDQVFKRRPDQAIFVDQVYSRENWDEKEFLFDVSDAHGEDSVIGSEVFGIISNQLDLPLFRMVCLPDVFQGSGFGRLMEKLLDKVLSAAGKNQGLEQVEFPERQNFNQKVLVFGKEPDAVRALLAGFQPPTVIQGQSPLFIGGVDDFLAVDFSQMSGAGNESFDLINLHNQFRQISRYFMR